MTTPMKRLTVPAVIDRLLGAPATTTAAPRGPVGWPGVYLGYGTKGPVFTGPEHHSLVIGPPRSGKTSRLIVPALACHPGAAVVTSTKPDVLAATAPWRRARGRCWLWDPTATTAIADGVDELRWSPIIGCHHWDTAVARAHALATAARPDAGRGYDSHWVERAQALLAPLLHAAAVTGTDMAAVQRWLHRRDIETPAALLAHHQSTIAADILEGIAVTDPREQSGIFSTCDGLLAAYRTNATLDAAAHPNFDPDAFAASADTIYICAPAATQNQHAALVVALLDQIRTAVYRHRPYPAQLWALDEVANIAPLPNLPATIAEGGSQGLVIQACLQDLSQARTRWGPAAEGFLTLFTHKIVLPGVADLATLRQISALADFSELKIGFGGLCGSKRWDESGRPGAGSGTVATLGCGWGDMELGCDLEPGSVLGPGVGDYLG